MIPIKDNIPTDRLPIVTVVLIVANVIVYFFLQKHSGGIFSGPTDDNTVRWGAIPYEFLHPGKHCELVKQAQAIACEGQRGVSGHADSQPSTIATAFSSMFMHGSILHIGGNMLFLWIFGNNVEDSMGRVRFIAFYVLGGLCALAGQILVSTIGGSANEAVPTLGASGAIAAVLGGYILLYPRARVITLIFIIFFFTIVELPALLVLGLWFLEQLLFGAAGVVTPASGGGGVAYFAHIGGFVFGLALIRAFAQRYKPAPPRFPVY